MRLTTADGDFVDIDRLLGQHSRAIILSHGLEGNSSSQYMKSASQILHQSEMDVYALNYRSCSGELNRTATMYHSGFTHDLHHLIESIKGKYREIHLVGFSLGGNMNLKYISDGQYRITDKIKSVCAVSAPIDLAGASECISSRQNYLYQRNFLQTLLPKMSAKAQQFPELFDDSLKSKVKSLIDFDEYFTGPLHGFTGAQDYYNQCGALQFLSNISIPSLLVSALDDPFLSAKCYPYEIAREHKYFHLLPTKYGGHVGFTTFGENFNWLDNKIRSWIQQNSNLPTS